MRVAYDVDYWPMTFACIGILAVIFHAVLVAPFLIPVIFSLNGCFFVVVVFFLITAGSQIFNHCFNILSLSYQVEGPKASYVYIHRSRLLCRAARTVTLYPLKLLGA
jgi:hypothetical protein